MANPLLEFVLSLVRDPEAAARYAADPERAIADAQLNDVTRLDVNSLIPVVSESMSAGAVDADVWTSGQAVAAFDAFGDELPERVVPDAAVAPGHEVIDTSVPDMPDRPTGADFADLSDLSDLSDDPVPATLRPGDEGIEGIDVSPDDSWFDAAQAAPPAGLDAPPDLPDVPDEASGFDAFGL